MLKYLSICTFTIVLLLNINIPVANSFESGDLKLSQKAVDSFYDYISSKRKKTDKFLVTQDGSGTFVWVCPQTLCLPAGENYYTRPCFKSNNNKPCKIFAIGRKIKWNIKGKIPSDLKKFKQRDSRNDLTNQLRKLGFID